VWGLQQQLFLVSAEIWLWLSSWSGEQHFPEAAILGLRERVEKLKEMCDVS
jgi:hypothetical protein